MRSVQHCHSFRESIRRTFLTYTLIPTALVTIACFAAAVLAVYLSAVHGVRQQNEAVSTVLSQACEAYSAQAMTVANDERTIACLRAGKMDKIINNQLYDFVNSQEVHCDFYLLDAEQNLISASESRLPSFLAQKPNLRLGILRKASESPGQVCLTIESTDATGDRYIAIGKEISAPEGGCLGTLVFTMSRESLFSAAREASSVGLVVTNLHDSVCWSTDGMLENRYGKLLDEFRGPGGLISALGGHFYCCSSQPIQNAFRVYTLMELGYNERIMLITGSAIALLLLLMVLGTLYASHKVAARQTIALDKVVKTMSHVQEEGWLEQPLVLETGDEFEQIALSYNRMLTDIRRLMEDNREIAQQSVLSEIEQLESQFEPHFLFNTLESVKYLIRLDPDKAVKAIVCLSDLLRESLDHSISQVTLAQDVAYTKSYLTIQKYRFEEQLNYSFQIPQELSGCWIPKRILQPIVENAIKYGSADDGHCQLWIGAEVQRGCLILTVEDGGKGMEKKELEKLQTLLRTTRNVTAHNGSYNVHRRIQLICGSQYGLRICSPSGRGLLVRMELPIVKEG